MPLKSTDRWLFAGGTKLPDADTTKVILDEVFAGATALAGLILVFLGAVFTSYDSYQPDQQADVAAKYKNRALISLIGFLSALVSASLALGAHWFPRVWIIYGSISTLGLSFILIACVAVIAVRDIG
jgi:hypothetical protein